MQCQYFQFHPSRIASLIEERLAHQGFAAFESNAVRQSGQCRASEIWRAATSTLIHAGLVSTPASFLRRATLIAFACFDLQLEGRIGAQLRALRMFARF